MSGWLGREKDLYQSLSKAYGEIYIPKVEQDQEEYEVSAEDAQLISEGKKDCKDGYKYDKEKKKCVKKKKDKKTVVVVKNRGGGGYYGGLHGHGHGHGGDGGDGEDGGDGGDGGGDGGGGGGE